MNGNRTLSRWDGDRDGSASGTLILWPDTSREMRLPLSNFKTANELGRRINEVTKEAYADGRRSMKHDILNIKE